MADICDKEAARAAFKGATCVMHLAAYIDYSFPADLAELHRVNVQGTHHTQTNYKDDFSLSEMTLKHKKK